MMFYLMAVNGDEASIARCCEYASINSCDEHGHTAVDLALINEKMSYKKNCRNFHDDITYYCTDCSWYNLLKTGTFDKENQNLSVRFLKKYLSRKYGEQMKALENTK